MSELVTIQSAATAVSKLATVTGSVIAQVRQGNVARAESRERLRVALREMRHHDIADAIRRLTLHNMDDIAALYDYAETKEHSNGYVNCLRQAEIAVRLLEENLQQLARELR